VLRRTFVTGVVSCGFVLLVSLALLARSLFATLHTNPGFDADGVWAMQISLPAAAYPDVGDVVSFYARLQSELDRRLPSAAIANELPLTGDRGRAVVSLLPAAAGPEAIVREVGTHYFDVMKIRLIAGRSFDGRDDLSAPSRAVISQSLSRRLFGPDSPIGRQIAIATRSIEVVGIVDDVAHRALDDPPRPTLYLSAWQTDSRSRVIAVRDRRAQADVVAIVRDVVARGDGSLPVYGVRSMRDIVEASPGVPARRVLTAAFAGFALLAVVLGAIGIFGVVAHDVAARRSELALRVALGAPARRLFGDTLRQGALMIGMGLIVGGGMTAWVARLLGALGATDGRLDPLSLIAGAMVIAVTGLGAVLPVARRAARTDPVRALTGE
jgi:putative ABC transport system permease protein